MLAPKSDPLAATGSAGASNLLVMQLGIPTVAARWGAAGFRSRWGRLALQLLPGIGRRCLHLGWWAFSGRSFLRSRGGPKSRWGSAPERAVCGGWRRSRVAVGWLAERPDSGAMNDYSAARMRTGQMRAREARSRVPHVTSRQDSKCNVQSTSTVHRSPTINPHYPLMSLPLRPIPVLKYWDFIRP